MQVALLFEHFETNSEQSNKQIAVYLIIFIHVPSMPLDVH
jgi:hypothetical protein